MQDSAIFANPASQPSRFGAGRLAWVVLIVAFIVFCFTCVVTGLGLNYFLFESTVPMQVALDVSRGTATFQVSNDPDENAAPQSGHYVLTNMRVRLDGQSQATLLFRDSYETGKLIGMVTMRPGSELYMGGAQRPRFEWSALGYRINLNRVSGDFDVYIPHGLDRPLVMTLNTSESDASRPTSVYLSGGGTYTVSAMTNEVQVYNREGDTAVVAVQGLDARLVATSERAIVSLGGEAPVIAQVPGTLDLLQPSALERTDVDTVFTSNLLLPDLVWPWQCGDSQSPPPGRYEVGMPDGRPAIRLFRGDGATTHGSTSCWQSPGPSQTGRDMAEFTSLVFRTSFYIEQQSVAACGIDGSECALTLMLDYVYLDAEGKETLNQWFHGFYVKLDPERQFPVRCSSCQVDHDYVYPGTWYTYESPNILGLLPEDQQPARLLRAGFYASGHEYDVYVGDVALYAN